MDQPTHAGFQPRDEQDKAFKGACRVARRLFQALEDDDAEAGPGTHRRMGRHSAVIHSSALGCWRTDVIVTADCRLMLTLIVADPNGEISDEAGGGVRLLDPSRPFDKLVDDANEWQIGCLTAMLATMV